MFNPEWSEYARNQLSNFLESALIVLMSISRWAFVLSKNTVKISNKK